MQEADPFERALQGEKPIERLRALVLDLARQGHDPPAILQRFEAVRVQLQAQQRLDDEDLVLEVMDDIVGWCSQERKLFPEYGWSSKIAS